MKTVTDHIGRTITYNFPPKRIISLCPGITETLYALKLDSEIIGRTKYCIYPKDKVKNAQVIGGTKEINIAIIRELNPDLIIVEKEENTKDIVEILEKYYPVYVAEVQSIPDAYRMITSIGDLTNRYIEASRLVAKIQTEFLTLPKLNKKRAAYVIWNEPYMVAGKDTYIQSILDEMGFINPFTSMKSRYPIVTVEDFQDAKLDYVLLATEPYPFEEKHKEVFLKMMPNATPIIVDGEMFWYGARMIKAAHYFKQEFILR
ncbi:ABC transporter substrate-binding protein [Sporosarcina sp. G11-34]|uniref:ABC transporter substrate-binding protein n=1 Tax=Sporosarcina sp. G11-34 TaxID=2849605 RepID=UPI0022A92BC5|nr:helical backbone metal receptor [Sporosarcina sp. G11-34]MCZ2256878.1 ABC transporter substrate-binding protein [Sporosarcina sp. G11-34]